MLQELAHAKINLGLKVLGKRIDGYHEMDMIMQSIGLHDLLEFRPSKQLTLCIKNSPELIADNQENLIIKAAKVLQAHTGYSGGAEITLDKRIPMAAGMAGGSSDAAAALRGLNRLWSTGLSTHDLEILSAQIGSDVAFCVCGGIQRATGRGEIVQPLLCKLTYNLIIFKPHFGVSTAQVYKNFNPNKLLQQVNIASLISALGTNNIHRALPFMGNDLESVTLAMHPVISAIKNRMLELGADSALMSGSGPTIFAIVSDKQTGDRILNILDKEYQGIGCFTQSICN